MTDPDDYPDVMKRLSRLTDRDIDRLLDGRAPEAMEDLDDLARHLGGLKRVQVHVPQDVAGRQIAQIVQASRHLRDAGWSAPLEASRSLPRRRGRTMQRRLALLTAKIGAVLVGASMLTVGLAFAGVQLPDALNDAAERAGFALPNQNASEGLARAQGQPEDAGRPEATGSDTSAAVLSAIDGWQGERDCWFGLTVASAATGEQRDTSPCVASDNGNAVNAQGSKATGDAKSAEGRSKAATASAGAQGSKATGDEASGGAASQGSKSTGDEASSGAPKGGRGAGGQSTGEEASDEGRSRRDNAPAPAGDTSEETD